MVQAVQVSFDDDFFPKLHNIKVYDFFFWFFIIFQSLNNYVWLWVLN